MLRVGRELRETESPVEACSVFVLGMNDDGPVPYLIGRRRTADQRVAEQGCADAVTLRGSIDPETGEEEHRHRALRGEAFAEPGGRPFGLDGVRTIRRSVHPDPNRAVREAFGADRCSLSMNCLADVEHDNVDQRCLT
jgi:hypothetical protein